MEWNGNFSMEYGRCQNGMEWKISRMEYNLSYFHTNSILNFVNGIYKKMYADVWQCRRTGRRGVRGPCPS